MHSPVQLLIRGVRLIAPVIRATVPAIPAIIAVGPVPIRPVVVAVRMAAPAPLQQRRNHKQVTEAHVDSRNALSHTSR